MCCKIKPNACVLNISSITNFKNLIYKNIDNFGAFHHTHKICKSFAFKKYLDLWVYNSKKDLGSPQNFIHFDKARYGAQPQPLMLDGWRLKHSKIKSWALWFNNWKLHANCQLEETLPTVYSSMFKAPILIADAVAGTIMTDTGGTFCWIAINK